MWESDGQSNPAIIGTMALRKVASADSKYSIRDPWDFTTRNG